MTEAVNFDQKRQAVNGSRFLCSMLVFGGEGCNEWCIAAVLASPVSVLYMINMIS